MYFMKHVIDLFRKQFSLWKYYLIGKGNPFYEAYIRIEYGWTRASMK